MIIDRLARLLDQAQPAGGLIAPPSESTFQVSAADRRWLWLSGNTYACLHLLFIVIEIVVARMVFGAVIDRLTPANATLYIFGVIPPLTVFLLVTGVFVYVKMFKVLGQRFAWLKKMPEENLALCQPLAKHACPAMLALVNGLDGGQDYQRKILEQGRPMYGFDLELLQRVQAMRAHHAETLAAQQRRERTAQHEDDACKALHGIA